MHYLRFLLKRYSGGEIKKCGIAGEWNTLGEGKKFVLVFG
jgi:hypothetical protein